MPIGRDDAGFLVNRDDGKDDLGVESAAIDACVEEAAARRVRGVFGSPDYGFQESNLDFLTRLPFLEGVWFWDVKLDNIDGLYALEGLKRFGVHPRRPGIDFSRFPDLESVVWEHRARDRGVGSLERLRRLHLWRFKPKAKSFEGLQIPPGVEELQLNFCNPVSLHGLPVLPNLRRLGISYARNLQDLDGLDEVAPNLEHLVVHASKHTGASVDVLERMPCLSHAWVQDRVVVAR